MEIEIPASKEFEEIVLGCCLKENYAAVTVTGILSQDDFNYTEHKFLFSCIKDLVARKSAVNINTLAVLLKLGNGMEKVGGYANLAYIKDMAHSGADIDFYIQELRKITTQRRLLFLAKEIFTDCVDSDARDKIYDYQKKLQMMLSTSGEFHSASEILNQFEEGKTFSQRLLEKRLMKESGLDVYDGIRSGFSQLDAIIGGFDLGSTNIVGARSSTGKTTFLVNLFMNIHKNYPDKRMGFFSLEMPRKKIVEKMLCSISGIPYMRYKDMNLTPEEYERFLEAEKILAKYNLHIYDAPKTTIEDIQHSLRVKALNDKLDIVFLDYLSRVQTSLKVPNKHLQIDAISKGIQTIALELNIPFVTLAQLNRGAADRKPIMSDLRESGCLSADTIIRDVNGAAYSIRHLAEGNMAITVFGLDSDLKIKPFKMTKVFESGIKKTYTLITKSGRRIRASANHPFYTINGWKPLENLSVKEHIAVPRELNFKGNCSIDDDELILLAHLLGDGCILPNQPYHYTSADDVNMQAVRDSAKRLFNIEAKTVAQGNRSHVYLRCPYHLTHRIKHPITKWFESLGIERVRSYAKRIPEKFFALSNEKLALFMKHLWATDGGLSTKKLKGRKDSVSMYYSTNSSVLAHQVQHLLLRFGILSKIGSVTKGEYKPNYHVNVYGAEMQLKFLRQIGCYGARGDKIDKYIEDLTQIKQNTNNDIIPKEIWDYIRKESTFTVRQFARNLGIIPNGSALYRNGISRSRMARIVSFMPDERLKNLAESSVYWDEVLSIEEFGEETVYDATVPGAHNFIANDIIVHNSIEEDADLIIMMYRPGLGNPHNTNKTTEIYVEKNRLNENLGKVVFGYNSGRFVEQDPLDIKVQEINNFGGTWYE